jgi:CheY-like chemotaxis protein
LLVVEDEPTILELLSGSLRLAGFEVSTAASGAEAVRAAASSRPDLVLLDVMMPDGDGFEALRRIRSGGSEVPVIFLTARDEVSDRVKGFDIGGDDYVTKPFSLEELLGRIRAVLKRTRPDAPASRLRVADLELDEHAHEVKRVRAPNPAAVRRGRLRSALRGVSLRTRVMATATLLVLLTSLVTAVLGTTLLRSYLLSRADSQLQDFATVATRIVQRQQLQPSDSSSHQSLPAQFLVEVVAKGGQVSMAGGPLGSADGPRLSAAQLSNVGMPFTAAAADASGGSWRVLVEHPSSGGHLVIASSLGDLDSAVTRLEVADALAAAVAVVLLAGLGLPLVRASLAPLREIESTAAIAGGDLSRRIDHAAGHTEVGRLAEALDMMLASIEAAYRARADGEARALESQDRMRRFIADASHELRTPLTSMRGARRVRPAAGPRGQPGGTAAAYEPDRPRVRSDGPPGGRSPAAGQVRRRARPRAPARRPGQHRGRGRPAGPHRGRRSADHARGGRTGDRGRRHRAAAPDHRQPDRQCHPAHPGRNTGGGDGVERAWQRATHRRRPGAWHDLPRPETFQVTANESQGRLP